MTVLIKDGVGMDINDFHKLFPDLNYTQPVDYISHGWNPVAETEPPTYDPITQYVMEIAPKLVNGHYEQDYEIVALEAATVAANEATAATQSRNAAKAQRTAAVEAITVTTATGNAFDGDETSQGRMARTIVMMQATKTKTTAWVLADNSTANVSVSELVEALSLSCAAQTGVWELG